MLQYMTAPAGLSLKERAYQHIRSGLGSGEYQPGTQLSEVALAERIGVGRTPVREALLLLEHDGFVEQVPRYGTFVKKISRAERVAMFELRELLEAYAAAQAAQNLNEAAIAKLGELCNQTLEITRCVRDNGCKADDELYGRAVVVDAAFHMLILHASRNPWLIRLVTDMHLMGRIWSGLRGTGSAYPLRVWASTWGEHTRVFRAVRRRDREAAAHWMRVHIRHGAELSLGAYDRQTAAQAAGAVALEWPAEVRDALSHLEQFGPIGPM